jgi:hypothetical protein
MDVDEGGPRTQAATPLTVLHVPTPHTSTTHPPSYKTQSTA